jgi:hypothetical protein
VKALTDERQDATYGKARRRGFESTMFRRVFVIMLLALSVLGWALPASAALPTPSTTRSSPTPCLTVCGAPNHR